MSDQYQFTEFEREFLHKIRKWTKKAITSKNKDDFDAFLMTLAFSIGVMMKKSKSSTARFEVEENVTLIIQALPSNLVDSMDKEIQKFLSLNKPIVH